MRSFLRYLGVVIALLCLCAISTTKAIAQEEVADQPAAEVEAENEVDAPSELDASDETSSDDESAEQPVESDNGNAGVPIAKAERKQLSAKRIALIRFEGEIKPMSEQYLYRKLDEAKEAGRRPCCNRNHKSWWAT